MFRLIVFRSRDRVEPSLHVPRDIIQKAAYPPKGKGQKSGHLPGTASTRTAKLIQLTITISPLGTEHTVISFVKAKGELFVWPKSIVLSLR